LECFRFSRDTLGLAAGPSGQMAIFRDRGLRLDGLGVCVVAKLAMRADILFVVLVLGMVVATPAAAQFPFQDRDGPEMARPQPVIANEAPTEAVPAEQPVVRVPAPRARPKRVAIPMPRPAPPRGTIGAIPSPPGCEKPLYAHNFRYCESASLTGPPVLSTAHGSLRRVGTLTGPGLQPAFAICSHESQEAAVVAGRAWPERKQPCGPSWGAPGRAKRLFLAGGHSEYARPPPEI
jgi:hypothetical protein